MFKRQTHVRFPKFIRVCFIFAVGVSPRERRKSLEAVQLIEMRESILLDKDFLAFQKSIAKTYRIGSMRPTAGSLGVGSDRTV